MCGGAVLVKFIVGRDDLSRGLGKSGSGRDGAAGAAGVVDSGWFGRRRVDARCARGWFSGGEPGRPVWREVERFQRFTGRMGAGRWQIIPWRLTTD